jgi:hypothetical protein
MTMMIRIITPIFAWQLGHIPEGVGCSPPGCFSLQKWQSGVGAGLGFPELIGQGMKM